MKAYASLNQFATEGATCGTAGRHYWNGGGSHLSKHRTSPEARVSNTWPTGQTQPTAPSHGAYGATGEQPKLDPGGNAPHSRATRLAGPHVTATETPRALTPSKRDTLAPRQRGRCQERNRAHTRSPRRSPSSPAPGASAAPRGRRGAAGGRQPLPSPLQRLPPAGPALPLMPNPERTRSGPGSGSSRSRAGQNRTRPPPDTSSPPPCGSGVKVKHPPAAAARPNGSPRRPLLPLGGRRKLAGPARRGSTDGAGHVTARS